MVAPLDDLDRRLISLLRANGRESVVRLAERLGVTRTTVNKRIERLVESGVIAGFSVRLHDVASDSAVRAITLVAVEGHDARDAIRQLRGIPQIAALHTTNGRWDLVAELSCESLGDLDGALAAIRSTAGVRDSETSILLSSAVA
ncbi:MULTISPECIES: Lrp/AsnC family transcriptional regulator [unclassified Microbacterium]|uniref:Lrp/AsnC family transcriptional regulator n=1 Tax=unclassified Microbacterium TaxID=2609290 RepID=UPI0006FA9723|nr:MULTISPECIES: Lrp/AsnC family transcriptional regulator [unclassified Microbacterium]KQP74171.1 AsnC family transcriptional regulator [Microbacterium sp. Leaf288]MDT0142642.1 Lrp/AsnC family transcriptional regulator [Microbacterium sp. PRC9]